MFGPRDSSDNDTQNLDDRLCEAALTFERSVEAGRPLTLPQLQALFPELAVAYLREILASHAQMGEWVGELLGVASTVNDPREGADRDDPPARADPDAEALRAELGATGPLVRLRRGGIGAVYRCEDPAFGRELAVKVLRPNYRGRADVERRFVEEARIGARLEHPGVVRVHDLGRLPDGRPYFTMKLVRGPTLADLLALRADVRQDRPRFVKVFEQICQTLAFAHSRGVIHLDLKSANVMVGEFGEVQVIDWGFAEVVGAGAGRAPGGGTWAWMSPEQARCEVDKLDARCDVFGLGAILCHILTGEPPYRSGMDRDVATQARAGDLDDALVRLGRCSAGPELLALAGRSLSVDRGDRPRDAREVADRVGAYQAHIEERRQAAERHRAAAEARAEEEVKTRQMAEARADAETRARLAAEASARAERRARRVQLALAASLLLLTLFGGGSGIWWWSSRSAQARETEAALVVMWYYLNAGRSVDARTSLERAEHAIAGGGSRALERHLLQARNDVNVVLELEEIRLRHSNANARYIDASRVQTAYAAAFRRYGVDVLALDPDDAATRLAASAVRNSLLLALDHWVGLCETDRARLLSRVVDAADDDGWRREFRAALCAGDDARMAALVSRPSAQKQSPAVLHYVADALSRRGRGDDAFRVLTAAHRWFPYNFWVNHAMAELVFERGPDRAAEAVGYYRAALALRPDSPAVNVNLASALAKNNDPAGAAAYYGIATYLDPTFAEAHYLYGRALSQQLRPADAEAEYRHALSLLPEHSPLRAEAERLMHDFERRHAPGH